MGALISSAAQKRRSELQVTRSDSPFHSTTPPSLEFLGDANAPFQTTRYRDLRLEDSRETSAYFVHAGIVATATVLSNGERSLCTLYFPGDIAGLSGAGLSRAFDNVVCLTDVVVSRITASDIEASWQTGTTSYDIFKLQQSENLMIAARLACLVASDALGAVASLMVEIVDRFRGRQEVGAFSVPLGLTQVHISELCGITSVHTNRVLRKLREDGIAHWHSGGLEVIDSERLLTVAAHRKRRSTFW